MRFNQITVLIILLSLECLLAIKKPPVTPHAKIRSDIDDDVWVRTPGRRTHRDCVHHVDDGSTVTKQDDGSLLVTRPNGHSYLIPSCPPEKRIEWALSKKRPSSGDSGWIEYALYQVAAANFNSFTGYWNVPDAPQSKQNQIIYLFNSFMNSGENDIIQPVLQWGTTPAGGGRYWAVASWYVSSTGAGVHSSLFNVTTTDSLYGTITQDSTGKWIITGKSTTTGLSTTLNVNKLDAQGSASVTLEVYDVISCNSYPSSDTTFSQLQLQAGGVGSNPAWKSIVGATTCGEKVVVQNTQTITLQY